MIRIEVQADPIPKGSASAMVRYRDPAECEKCGRKGDPYAQVFADNAKTKRWERLVREAARPFAGFTPSDGPFAIGFEFRLKRPKGHYRANGELKPRAMILFPTGRGVGDWDKLVRSTQDALEGLFFVDDSQVVECLGARKRYVMSDEEPGVTIVLQEIEVPARAEARQPELALSV